MPSEVAAQFDPLFKEILWLTSKWSEFNKLYAADKETIELINRSAGYFFVIVQDTMWDDLLLHLARLSGPEKSMGKANLSIFQIATTVEIEPLKTKLKTMLKERDTVFSFTDDHRNKRLAHHDLGVAIEGVSSIPGSSRLQIRKAIEFLQKFASAIYEHYADTTFVWNNLHNTHDANRLLSILRRFEARPGSER